MGSGISRTLQSALSIGNQSVAQSKNDRDQEQALLLQNIGKLTHGQARYPNSSLMNSGNSYSSSNSSNDDYHDTMDGEQGDKDGGRMGLGDNTTHYSGTSTLSSNSKLKSNAFEARILNPNGFGNKAYCLRPQDTLIIEELRLRLHNNTPRMEAHNTRRPTDIGYCYVYVTDGKDIWTESIEQHIEIITQLVMVEGCKNGILGDKGDNVFWLAVKSNMTDVNAVWDFKGVISVTLANTIANSSYTKEWQTKWSKQISSILTTMKTNFNPDIDGK
jgi:hypothetical protein